jgi:hypothetical protein
MFLSGRRSPIGNTTSPVIREPAALMLAARTRPLWYLVAALAALLALQGAVSTSAHAEYGELAHFRFSAGEGSGEVLATGGLAFAVDPNEGAFYLADEPKRGTFRIQRFNAKGQVEPGAAISFAPPGAKKGLGGEGVLGNGGVEIAIDPKRQRVYLLLLYERREINEKEEKEEEKEEKEEEKGEKPKGSKHEHFPLDAEERAAGQLYAFEFTGGKLVATKEKEGAPTPLVNEGATGFKSQGEQPKEALLNPRGLAVDPVTGNVVIAGDQDQQQNSKVEKEEGEKECRAALQWVEIEEKTAKVSGGKPALRYVDKKSVLEPEETTCEPEEYEAIPYAPVVTATGRVLAEVHENQVWEIPASDEAGEGERETKPSLAFTLNEQQELLEFGAEEATGPTMSLVPEGAGEGRLYLAAAVRRKQIAETAQPAVLEVHFTDPGEGKPLQTKVIGWTAGAASEAGKHEGCAIPSPTSGRTALLGGFKEAVVGGKEGVIALDAFQHEGKETVEAFEYGPAGSGAQCPHTSATSPSVKVSSAAVSTLPPAQAASLSSEITSGDITRVEWQFENVTTHEKEAPLIGGFSFAPNAKHELVGTTSGEHAFAHEGKYKITELLQSDNLATPTVEATREILVQPPPVEIELSGPVSVAANEQAARFEASVKDSNEPGTPHLTYVWKFGDGGEAKHEKVASATGAEEHVYSAPGSYTVTLEVTDGLGGRGVTTTSITVHGDRAEEEAAAREADEARKHREEAEAAAHKAEAEAAARKGEEEAAAKRKAEEAGKGGVQGNVTVHNPAATLAGTSISVSPSGALTVKVNCPSGVSSCIGTITLRTVGAVSASAGKKTKKAVLTLGTASFTVTGGQTKAVALHLSSKAKALLARSHTLRAQATLIAHDTSGTTRTVKTAVSLRLVKKKH